ncbi:hypothetical protein ACFW9L_02110 [Streptomyces sp. NPDC059517]|uniref:hypothetical protein n=1 Tax=Streptomyces sp. NPDC059517 TaxID=3346855 RepID=UPI00367A9157
MPFPSAVEQPDWQEQRQQEYEYLHVSCDRATVYLRIDGTTTTGRIRLPYGMLHA